MKKILAKALLWAAAGVLPVSMAWSQGNSDGLHKIEVHEVQSLEVEGHFNVTLTQGLQESVEIEAPAAAFMKMKAKQSGKSFELSVKDKDVRSYNGPFNVNITLKNPEKISLEGAAKLKMEGVFTCKKIALELDDESKFEGEIRASETVSFEAQNHSSLKASIHAVKSCKMELSGYASAEVSGYAPLVSLSQKDASKLEARSFRTDKLDAKMSNHTTAVMTVNATLTATTEDASVLLYDGMPKTKVHSSGVSKVHHY